MLITPIKTRIFLENENLIDFIEEHVSIKGHSELVLESRFLHPQEGQVEEHKPGVEDFSLQSKGQKEEGFSQGENDKNMLERPGQILRTSEGHNQLLEDGDILVITSKIVALSEGRTFVADTLEDKLEYIKKESTFYTRTKYVHLTIHDRMPMPNAGIDESNADGKCIMLPRDSFASAYEIWKMLRTRYQLNHLGIIITDSRTIPFRNGTTGVSLGHAGFEAIRNYTDKADLFGRPFHYARTNVPDALAVSAVHVMGEGDECQPLAIIKNPLVTWSEEEQTGDDMTIDPEDDMYTPLFRGC